MSSTALWLGRGCSVSLCDGNGEAGRSAHLVFSQHSLAAANFFDPPRADHLGRRPQRARKAPRLGGPLRARRSRPGRPYHVRARRTRSAAFFSPWSLSLRSGLSTRLWVMRLVLQQGKSLSLTLVLMTARKIAVTRWLARRSCSRPTSSSSSSAASSSPSKRQRHTQPQGDVGRRLTRRGAALLWAESSAGAGKGGLGALQWRRRCIERGRRCGGAAGPACAAAAEEVVSGRFDGEQRASYALKMESGRIAATDVRQAARKRGGSSRLLTAAAPGRRLVGSSKLS